MQNSAENFQIYNIINSLICFRAFQLYSSDRCETIHIMKFIILMLLVGSCLTSILAHDEDDNMKNDKKDDKSPHDETPSTDKNPATPPPPPCDRFVEYNLTKLFK